MNLKEMVERFQCPGCVSGSDTECGQADYGQPPTGGCRSHSAGTIIIPGGRIYLGLPKGFDKVGSLPDECRNNIRLFNDENPHSGWDQFNLPVWAMEYEGFLLVRTFSPRINCTWVDVIEGGTIADVPGAVDVSKFHNEID